ncbi:hypothetical protein RQP46_002876 [Phenoliferia psychrophenolica]
MMPAALQAYLPATLQADIIASAGSSKSNSSAPAPTPTKSDAHKGKGKSTFSLVVSPPTPSLARPSNNDLATVAADLATHEQLTKASSALSAKILANFAALVAPSSTPSSTPTDTSRIATLERELAASHTARAKDAVTAARKINSLRREREVDAGTIVKLGKDLAVAGRVILKQKVYMLPMRRTSERQRLQAIRAGTPVSYRV